MSDTTETAALQRAPRRLGHRVLRSFGMSVAVVAVGAAGAYLASQVVPPLHAQLSADTTGASSFPCDSDGVAVGYDLTYSPGIHSFAVDHVRVVGIDSSCDGGPLEVALDTADGTALAGGTATTTVSGTAMRLTLAQPVPAAQVGMVEVALGGVSHTVDAGIPTPTVTTPTTTVTVPPTITVAAEPTLCSTVSGVTSATGTPANCGAVAAPPTTTTPVGQVPRAVAVVSWRPRTFSKPVTVNLAVPPKPMVPHTNFAVGTFVQLVVTDEAGNRITQFEGVLALDFPAPPADYLPLYSEDGIHWRTIPLLASPELPDGQPDGYYAHDDGAITILTRHATVWSLARLPASVGAVNAASLPNRRVRLGWHAAAAGLGVHSYQVLRDGRLIATVRTTRTTVALGPKKKATFRIRAVDRAGQRGPLSAPVSAEARVVTAVGAPTVRRKADGVVISAWVRLAEAARLTVSVQTPQGKWVPLLRGSAVAGRRVGGARLATAPAQRGLVRIVVRIPSGSLRPGLTGTLRIGATVSPRTVTPPLAQRFIAPR